MTDSPGNIPEYSVSEISAALKLSAERAFDPVRVRCGVPRLPRAGFVYFHCWFCAWSTAILKYQDISDTDFDIDSVADDFDVRAILPSDYVATADEKIPQNKIDAQLRATTAQLSALVDRRTAAGARS